MAGHRGLQPGASSDQVRDAYMYGVDNDRGIERAARRLLPTLPVASRTRGSNPTHGFDDRSRSSWVGDVVQGSRQPSRIAAYHDAADRGDPRIAQHRASQLAANPSVLRSWLDSQRPSEFQLEYLLAKILHPPMFNFRRSGPPVDAQGSRALAGRGVRALVKTRNNPHGMPAEKMFKDVVINGNRQAVQAVVAKLPPRFVQDNFKAIRRVLAKRRDPDNVLDLFGLQRPGSDAEDSDDDSVFASSGWDL